VSDAYAGHDSFLEFRYTNLSEHDAFKVSLEWDDPETKDRLDFHAETRVFVKPLTSVLISNSAVFDRIGTKEISDLKITIVDEFGAIANFRAKPFRFKVESHDKHVIQNINTHNQISIEGRGVVDASGMGVYKNAPESNDIKPPFWVNLGFRFIHHDLNDLIPQINFDKNDLQSVLKAANFGNAFAQEALGDIYFQYGKITKDDVSKENYKLAIQWYLKAAEHGLKSAQYNLGYLYHKCLGMEPDTENALLWYAKAAEQGHEDAVNEIKLINRKQANANAIDDPHEDYFTSFNAYTPSRRRYTRITNLTDFAELLRGIDSSSPLRNNTGNWHYLICSSESMKKVIIRDMIFKVKDSNFSNIRATSGEYLPPKDLAAILTSLESNSLLELNDIDRLGTVVSEILQTVLRDSQLDLLIGEGPAAREIKLDLEPFCSINYCTDINIIPPALISSFDCCFIFKG